MNARHLALGLVAVGVLGLGGYGLYQLGKHHGGGAAATAAPSPASGGDRTDPATGRRVLYWHDPMVPGRRFDKPGKSPFMDMQLVPVYADEAGDAGGVAVSPRLQQTLGIRTAEVARGTIASRIKAVGSIGFNERDQAVVQARSTGYVEKLHVRATLDRVKKGQPLADLYVPEWVAAQEEFLAVRRMQGSGLAELAEGARQRMRLLGMSDEQIALVERTGRAQRRTTLLAPASGVVVELAAREGMTVSPGATLFRINDLSTVWVRADVPESQSALLRAGAAVEARSPALPGRTFNGRVQAILPEVSPATRTVKARIELANPKGELAPGMFVSVALDGGSQQGLTVPTEAVIQTGRRTVVMVAEDGGRFRAVEVGIGREAEGRTEITKGLDAGQKVVVSGQFLLDSEASLRAAETPMEQAAVPPSAAAAPRDEHTGRGKVEAVARYAVTLSHEPIPSVGWGAMTMDFGAPAGGVPPGVKPGQAVTFAFRMGPDGTPALTRIEPAAGAPTPAPPAGKRP